MTRLVLFLIALVATLGSCKCTNTYYGNSVAPVRCILVQCTQMVQDDFPSGRIHPLFVRAPGTWGAQDLGDLHLRAGSAAIDIGNPIKCSPTDLAGNAHVGKCDAGAYEYVGAMVEASAQHASFAPNAPTQANDDYMTTNPNRPLLIRPLFNDDNPDISPLQIINFTSPAHGTLSLLNDTFTYTPTTNYEGFDSFIYTVQDGDVQTSATVYMRVAPLAYLTPGILREVEGGNPLAVTPGSTITYTIGIYNPPLSMPAMNVQLTDTLPSGLSFTNWITQSTAEINGNILSLKLSTLPTNTVVLIGFTAQANQGTELAGTDLANVMTVSATNADLRQAKDWLRIATVPEHKIWLPVIKK